MIDDCDVVCVAKNEALLDGLLTVFHVERSSDELLNLQNDLPLLSEYDKECLISLALVSLCLVEGCVVLAIYSISSQLLKSQTGLLVVTPACQFW